jgi:hypothetical protein
VRSTRLDDNKKAARQPKGKNALNGQAGGRTEVTRRGGEGVRRRVLAGSWVAGDPSASIKLLFVI